jgi:predicted GTPase
VVERVIIMGAAGRDFHDFNVVFRHDPETIVVAFTASQIPGIDYRIYPASLAGPRYPKGIPIVPEADLAELIRREGVTEVLLSYSDLSHEAVMHKASAALAAGADFGLLSPTQTMLAADKKVIGVVATRTGSGKSQTSRYVASTVIQAGLKPVLVRHPMPYGDLEAMRCQRFASLADIDASAPTIEEREEYEEPVRQGMVVYAGVDYTDIVAQASAEADVIIWDGGNNDTPFFVPDLYITVADALRPGHELSYHPGELNVRMADIVVVNKVDSANPSDVDTVEANIRAVNPEARIVRAASPVTLDPGPPIEGRRVLVVEDGPTLTHGGMSLGAGTVAAVQHGARIVDPRPFACGTIAEVFEAFPSIGPVLPAMGYSDEQVHDLEATIQAVDCDLIICGTPVDLAALVDADLPIRRVRYGFADQGEPTLGQLIRFHLKRWFPDRP